MTEASAGATSKVFVRNATGLTRQVSGISALMANLVAMGVATTFFYTFFASLLYTGVDLPLTVLVGIAPAIVVGLVYYLFSVAMPRTGGEYVWVSRTLNPSLGFLANFIITSILWESFATATAISISFGLVPMLGGLGLLYHNSNLTSLATTFSGPPYNLAIIIAIISVSMIPAFLGTKAVFRTLWVIFLIAALGTLVTAGAFLIAGPSTFQANFNAMSGMNFNNVISTAALPKGFTLAGTLFGSVFTIEAFFGYNWSTYYNGEVKKVERSQLLGIIGGIFVFAIFMGIVFESAYYAMGPDFVNAISALGGTGNAAYTLPGPPVLNMLVVFAAPNAVVVVLAGLAVLALAVSSDILFSFIVVRNMFAWSFDRVLPEWFTRLDAKRGAPYLALLVTWVLTVIAAFVYVYTTVFQFIIYQPALFNIAYLITSVAAIVFPYWKKPIFETAPDIVKKKVGGVPVISILGILGVIFSAFVTISALLPAVTPPPSGSVIVQYFAYLTIPVTIIAAFVIFGISYYYRKSHGLNLQLAFQEIPPE